MSAVTLAESRLNLVKANDVIKYALCGKEVTEFIEDITEFFRSINVQKEPS